jgi:sec-independent protein translocase protein TatB
MFDFAWSEIALVGVVALIAIGPKDMPVAIRTMTTAIKKMRRMAGEFQGQMDELVREANLTEVRDQIQEIRGGLNVRQQIGRMIDPDRSIRSAFADPMAAGATAATTTSNGAVETVAVGEFPEYSADAPHADESRAAITLPDEAAGPHPPAFIPPGLRIADRRPAFIPPGIRR